jgi:6-phosphofructokinase 2
MADFVTITFNPCIDRYATVPFIAPERKLHCSEPVLNPGGGGINVARALHNLGADAIAIYPSGGYTGIFLDHLLSEEGVHGIPVKTQNETRENIIIYEESTNNQYRFGMPGNPLVEAECTQIISILEQLDNYQYLVISGSFPASVPSDIFQRINKVVNKKKIRLIVDTSGPPLKWSLNSKPFLIKPNVQELASLTGDQLLSEEEMLEAAKHLISKGKCENIVISMGAKGVLLISEDNLARVIAPAVEPFGTVGAGDCVVAGIACALFNELPLLEAVRYGVACGTAATLRPGTELCLKKDADHLLPQVTQIMLKTNSYHIF